MSRNIRKEGYKSWINTNIKTEELENIRALMARTNRILNLSWSYLECNAYEAPFSEKKQKLSLRMLPSIFHIHQYKYSEDMDGTDTIFAIKP